VPTRTILPWLATDASSCASGIGLVGAAFIIFVPNIAEGISKGLSGAVFGVLLFLVIYLVPHGARQVAILGHQLAGKLRKN